MATSIRSAPIHRRFGCFVFEQTTCRQSWIGASELCGSVEMLYDRSMNPRPRGKEPAMSNIFERLLIDPDESSLRQTFHEACGKPWLAVWESHWRQILDEMAATREGKSQLFIQRGGSFTVAWWTDYLGRRHVRVAGGAAAHRHSSRLDEDPRPPLWHVYPERIFRVHRPERESVWLASCACGATGPPDKLAWMGPWCGPCHDRREEGTPLPFADRRTIPSVWPRQVHALAFSPDGDTLAVSSTGRQLNLHDLKTGKVTLLYGGDDADEEEEFRPVAFSPDGRWVAAGDPREQLIRIWSLQQPEAKRIDLILESDYPLSPDEVLAFDMTEGPGINALTFSPNGALLAACTAYRRVHHWRLAEGSWDRVVVEADEAITLAFSPDGHTLAIGMEGGNVQLFDTATWEMREWVLMAGGPEAADVMFLDYTPDGISLVLITGRDDQNVARLRLWNLSQGAAVRSTEVPVLSAVALSPDGCYLAWVCHDQRHSPAEVAFRDVQKWESAGALEWDPEDDVRELAFSPDGQTLATGSSLGIVKLFPWRLLLEA
jgi:hypothetical protein